MPAGIRKIGYIWTAPNVEALKELFYEGKSCAEIALEIPNATRSAVIGKLHRLGLATKDRGKFPPRTRGVIKVDRPKRARVSQPPMFYKEPDMPRLPDNDAIRLHSRAYKDLDEGMCRWPLYWEQGVQMYCAAKVERLPGRWASYCACHQNAGTMPSKYRGIWRGPNV